MLSSVNHLPYIAKFVFINISRIGEGTTKRKVVPITGPEGLLDTLWFKTQNFPFNAQYQEAVDSFKLAWTVV